MNTESGNPEFGLDDLSALLHALHLQQEKRLGEEFQRSLSFADGFFDRWDRAKRLGFGEKTSIYDSSAVFGDVSIGENTWIGPFTVLDGSGGPLTIGSYCAISAGVHIYTHDSVAWALTAGSASRAEGPVSIGDSCYIGSQSVVAAGVSIGTQCVVAANSFVNRDVPDGTIVGGSPARPIGTVRIEGEEVHLEYGNRDA